MNGYEFVADLINQYGLLEGYRVAKRYLEVPYKEDPDERKFREQIKIALWKVDQI